MAATNQQGFQPYVFDDIYRVTGGPGKPIHTRARLSSIRFEHSILHTNNNHKAVLTDLFGKKITVTMELADENKFRKVNFTDSEGMHATLKLGLKDHIHIETHGVMPLASRRKVSEPEIDEKQMPHVDPKELLKVFNMQKCCPFWFEPQFHDDEIPNTPLSKLEGLVNKLTDVWEKSQLRKDLKKVFEMHAQRMRPIKKIVCFGLGPIITGENHAEGDDADEGYDAYIDRIYIQHLAASNIAHILFTAQSSSSTPPTIEVFAQDPLYTPTCATLLSRLSPPIQILNAATAEGLMQIDHNTLIISINTDGTVIEPVLDLTSEEGGPAGILHHAWTKRAEEEWKGKVVADDEEVGHNSGWGSVAEWAYKDRCVRVEVSDDKWFGLPWNEVMGKINTEVLYVER
jgi:hypothetical protein